MAAKRSTKKTRRTSASTRRTKAKAPSLSTEARREITAVFLGAMALLLSFAAFNFGGSLVTSMFHGLRVGMGYSAYLLPLIFASLAWMLFQPTKYAVNGLNYIGFVGLVSSLAALFHIGMNAEDGLSAAQTGYGGGYLGLSITTWMLGVLNSVAAAIVLIALMAIFLILATNTNLKALFGAILAGFTREGKPAAETVAEMRPEMDQLKVNDNSGSPMTVLPMRGELNVGSQKPAVVTMPAKSDEPKEALTANSEEAWTPPGLELLESTSSSADPGDVKANAGIIQKTMESFGINVKMGEVNVGPTVTQYTFLPPPGVKLNKITGLDTNLALSLAAHPIRIEAPIPGKSAVGVEIPNKTIATVRLRDVLSAPEITSKKTPLTFVLGRDVSGTPMSADLAAMPHLLIAGATGSGKSVMINALLTSLLYRNAPADMKLILVDPKRVELGLYNDIPHLLTPVIVEPENCISALKWAVAEMERRYKLLADMGNRNIVEYNTAHKGEAMPYIVIVIDELADLMVLAAADVETLIVRLAQMARAVGIHLVLATQRPSVDVITGIIKANIPARLAFSVASQIDSRTILDQMGAEKLLGKGDMLFSSPEYIKPRRIQGVYIDDKETKALTDYLRSARSPQYNDEVLAQKVSFGGRKGGSDIGEPDDDMFDDAAAAVFAAGKASASMLQRRLRVGYARAARLLDLLEERGIIGPADGARPRDVLISSLDQVRAGSAPLEVMRQAEPYDE
jgi:S-DNA-T family DNA segregation ATPase FtsK/SpoIIIE